MFDNPSVFLKIFAILIIIALFIYRIQLFALWKKKKDYRMDVKVNKYLNDHGSNIRTEPMIDHIQREILPPRFHVLKVNQSNNTISVLFSYSGGSIYNIEVKSNGILEIAMEPTKKLLNKTSGWLKFSTGDAPINQISFELYYSDDFNPTTMRRYKYFIATKKIEATN